MDDGVEHVAKHQGIWEDAVAEDWEAEEEWEFLSSALSIRTSPLGRGIPANALSCMMLDEA